MINLFPIYNLIAKPLDFAESIDIYTQEINYERINQYN